MTNQENKKKRYSEHHAHDDSARKRIAGHEEYNGDNHCEIENQSCYTICIKPGSLDIFAFCCINNMQDHGHDDKEHTKGNCYDKDCIQFPQER